MLPASEHAHIDPAKVRDYFLSDMHPVGRLKAVVFQALGYKAEEWEVLRDDLLCPCPYDQSRPWLGQCLRPEVRDHWQSAWAERSRSQIHLCLARTCGRRTTEVHHGVSGVNDAQATGYRRSDTRSS